MLTVREVQEFVLAHVQAGRLGILDEEELVHGIEDVLLAPEELHELLVLVGSSVIGEVAHHSHGVELAVAGKVLQSLRNLDLIACTPSVADVRVGDDGKGKPCLLTDGDEQWTEVFAADGKDGCAGITRVVLRHGKRQRAVGKGGLAPVGICAYRGILVGLDGDGFCRGDERKGDCAFDNLVGREGGSARGCQRTDNVGLCPKLRHGAKDNEQREKYMSFHLDWHFVVTLRLSRYVSWRNVVFTAKVFSPSSVVS